MALNRVEIQDCWDQIKPFVEDLVIGTHTIAEDVYAACKYKHAHVFMCGDGFVILQEQYHEMDKAKELVVWFGNSFGKSVDLINKYEDEIKEISRGVGAKRIVFFSSRVGFSRALPAGWRMRSVTYELEI